MLYAFVVIYAMFLVSYYDFHKEHKMYRNLNYSFLCVILILIAGLRYKVGGDTIRYMESFMFEMPTLDKIRFDGLLGNQYSGGSTYMPLSLLLFSFCKSISNSFYFLQLVCAGFINIVFFWFFKKHTPYYFAAALFFIVISYLEFNTEIMRESIAIAFTVIGMNALLKKKIITYYFYCFIALGFHLSALSAFAFPLFMLIKFNWKSIIICAGICVGVTIIYLRLPNLINTLTIINYGLENNIMRYYNEEANIGNNHMQILWFCKWIIIPLSSIIAIMFSRRKHEYIFWGMVLIFIVYGHMSRYSLMFQRFNNFILPYVWILIGTGMVCLANKIRFFKSIGFVYVTIFISFTIICFYLFLLFVDSEGWLKYYPYTSIFNEIELNRPEW